VPTLAEVLAPSKKTSASAAGSDAPASYGEPMYDLIGDIHGHADELVGLLERLGYRRNGGCYRHLDRKVIFLGDFIDRGPKILQVVQIARAMVEEGAALAVMGNHELNALAYHTEDPDKPGDYLRRHSDKNIGQHRKTMEQLQPEQLRSALEWFRTLPLWLELDRLRVVHACWDAVQLEQVQQALQVHGGVTTSFLKAACTKGSPVFNAVEAVLKGKEAKLPDGISFKDEGGAVRTEIRTKWYLSPKGHTYGSYALQSDKIPCDLPLAESVMTDSRPYGSAEKPVFIGHYWLSAARPERLAENVACLDYSVAKGGFLCGYRWDGEQKVDNERFVRLV
jgi:hypothetical protein